MHQTDGTHAAARDDDTRHIRALWAEMVRG